MAIGAQECFARDAEAFHMDLMRNPVAGPAEMYPIPRGSGLEKPVIIGILAVCLQQVVIYILGCQFDPYPIKSQGLELQHGESPVAS